MYELQGAKFSRVFEWPPEFVAVAVLFVKPRLPTRAFVKLDEQGPVAKSRRCLKTMVSSLMKRKDAVSVASSFWFRDSCCINITVPRAKSLISLALTH